LCRGRWNDGAARAIEVARSRRDWEKGSRSREGEGEGEGKRSIGSEQEEERG